MCTAAVSVVAGPLAGLYIDWMRRIFPDAIHGKDFCYRLIPVWSFPLLTLGLVLLVMLYREWRRLGGEAFVPHSGGMHSPATPEVQADVAPATAGDR